MCSKSIFLCLALLWFTQAENCWSVIFTWLGLMPAQIVQTVVVWCTPALPRARSHLCSVLCWLCWGCLHLPGYLVLSRWLRKRTSLLGAAGRICGCTCRPGLTRSPCWRYAKPNSLA